MLNAKIKTCKLLFKKWYKVCMKLPFVDGKEISAIVTKTSKIKFSTQSLLHFVT